MIALYETRITFGFASLLPLLILPGYVILGALVWTSRNQIPSLPEVRMVFEMALAVSGGLSAAHLMTIEREEGFDEIRRTYPEHSWRMPLLRAVQAAAFIIIVGLITAGGLALMGRGYPLIDTLIPAIPPALWLCGLALLINNVSGSYWVSSGVIAGYWIGDYITRGTYSGVFFLFNHSMPQPDIDPLLNRVALLALALIAFALNTAYSSWRRGRG